MTPISRRDVGRILGAGLGGAVLPALLRPRLAGASLPPGVPDDVVQLNSNENPYGPSAAALQAVANAHRGASRYPDAAEALLLDALARRHGVARENIVLGCGSGEVLRMADGAFLGPGRGVVVSEPTFEAVLNYARAAHAPARQIPQTADFRHDLPRMAEACGPQTGMAYVCNPNNPTGTFVTRDELKGFLDAVPPTVTVLVDEAYDQFVEDPRYGSAFEWILQRPNLVVVRTFSKIYGLAGLRLGYAVATAENIRAMRGHATWDNANALALAAALASLGDEAHVATHRQRNADTRRWLAAELTKDGRRFIPAQANFMMIHVGRDVGPVIQKFQEKGVLTGRRFQSMPDWLRISLGTREEMGTFLARLREIVPARGTAAA
jgi:histidinol-phosphate aminotransferase